MCQSSPPAPQNAAHLETGALRIQLVKTKLGWGGAAPIPQDWHPRKGETWTQKQECTWGDRGRDRGDTSTSQGMPLAADKPAGAGGERGRILPAGLSRGQPCPQADRGLWPPALRENTPQLPTPPACGSVSRLPQGACTEAMGAPHLAASMGLSALGVLSVGWMQGLNIPQIFRFSTSELQVLRDCTANR